MLSPDNPSQSSWARARAASGTGKQFDEGLDLGDKAFSKALSPDDMEAQMANLTAVGKEAYRIGARAGLRDDIANAATQFGENEAAKARSLLGSTAARSKTAQLSQKPAETRDPLDTLDAEAEFQGLYQKTLQNSETEPRRQASKLYPAPSSRSDAGAEAAQIGQRTMFGAGLEGAYRIVNWLSRGALDEQRRMIAQDAAELLIARGAALDEVVAAMTDILKRENLSEAQAQAVQDIIAKLVRGSQPQATSQVLPD